MYTLYCYIFVKNKMFDEISDITVSLVNNSNRLIEKYIDADKQTTLNEVRNRSS